MSQPSSKITTKTKRNTSLNMSFDEDNKEIQANLNIKNSPFKIQDDLYQSYFGLKNKKDHNAIQGNKKKKQSDRKNQIDYFLKRNRNQKEQKENESQSIIITTDESEGGNSETESGSEIESGKKTDSQETDKEELSVSMSEVNSKISQDSGNSQVTSTSESQSESETESGSITGPETENENGGSQTSQTKSEFQVRSNSERPVVKMSVGLLNTYKTINKKYYEKKMQKELKNKSQGSLPLYNNGYDDENYNYVFKENEIFAGIYQIVRNIGVGSFGQVVQAFDHKSQKYVAIKIIKSKSAFNRQGLIEKQILERLNQADPEDEHHVVKLLDSFKYRNHLCFVFELLSLNLYEVLKKTKLKGISILLVKALALQIAETLQFLKSKNAQIIHCDLKPENILLENPRKASIKVIDFGSSCGKNQKIHTYIQSRFYRSPEILLKMNYSYPIDMWSFGCILVELRTGKPLFPGRNEFEQMSKIVEVLGIPPDEILNKAPGTSKFFEKNRNEKWVLKTFSSKKTNTQFRKRSLSEILRIPTIGYNKKTIQSLERNVVNQKTFKTSNSRYKELDYSMIYEHLQFKDLILKMLDYNPITRITPIQVMKHPFFRSRFHKTTQTNKLKPINTNNSSTNTNNKDIFSLLYLPNKKSIQKNKNLKSTHLLKKGNRNRSDRSNENGNGNISVNTNSSESGRKNGSDYENKIFKNEKNGVWLFNNKKNGKTITNDAQTQFD
ncbi:serine/threonine-protein kinase minibrain [Anaeramoeba flamelloides]|uniref:Serine/threonine-protein kinase minibrain n=1 Tax=Anaeramoeba flamelloides TaxID=1746091 RepID=A0ABQ8Z390_9EUKA|nr:serine/threonine-protein kinase minibrain [Anaeramoeba flamelloides]